MAKVSLAPTTADQVGIPSTDNTQTCPVLPPGMQELQPNPGDQGGPRDGLGLSEMLRSRKEQKNHELPQWEKDTLDRLNAHAAGTASSANRAESTPDGKPPVHRRCWNQCLGANHADAIQL